MEPYVHLSADERMRIYDWQRVGLAQAEMARRLGRDRATISRELRRNAVPAGYLPDLAHRRYQARRRHCRRRPRLENRRLRQTVVRLLERGLSPEQISGRLRAEQGTTVINHETIYRFVYESPLGRQEKLYQYLRRGKKKRTQPQGRRSHVGPIAGRLFTQLWVRGRSVPCVSSEMMVNTASVSVGQGPMGLSRLTVNMNVFPNLFLKRRPAWSARALIFAMDW